jgi:hypothetical protein
MLDVFNFTAEPLANIHSVCYVYYMSFYNNVLNEYVSHALK